MGQQCSAGSRIFVQDTIYDAFVKHFTAATQIYKSGSPFETATVHGPQISQTQFDVRNVLSPSSCEPSSHEPMFVRGSWVTLNPVNLRARKFKLVGRDMAMKV